MRAGLLVSSTLALAALLGLAGTQASVPAADPAPPAVVTATPGTTLAAAHTLLMDAPALEVNGDALSEVASVETLRASWQECSEDARSLTPWRTRAPPPPPCALAALGRRAHPPTAPPRSA
ncbi:MAG: hypothetical protein LJF06_18350 [Gemmatimonadetes bacterium]|nr:hypothetical protein [Gemmatimonadota bacterium]